MPVDTSFYPKANPPVDPMTQIGNMMGVVGQINQNKLFQQTNAAKLALGQAYRDATNPLTGELDEAKLMTLITQDGNPASFLAPDVRAQAMANRQAKLTYQTGQFELFKKQYDQGNTILSSLPKNAGPEDALKAINNAVSNGLVPYEMGVGWAADLLKDPSKFPDWLQQRFLQTQDAGKRADLKYGTIQQIVTGQTTELVAASPMTGVQPLGSFRMGPSPDATLPYTMGPTPQQNVQNALTGADILQIPTPGGKITATRAQAARMGGGIPGGAAPGAGGGMGAVIPYGTEEAGGVEQKGAAEQGVALMQQADQVPMRQAGLRNMLSDLQKFSPGVGSDWKKFAKSSVNSWTPFNLDPAGIASQEDFNKQARLIAIQQSGLMGAGTNEKLDAAMGASPNSELTKLGNQAIIHKLLGNEDAIAMKNKAWQSWKTEKGPGTYSDFSTDFNQHVDPRIYQLQHMPKDERNAYVKALPKADQDQLRAKATWLQKRGLLKVSGD